MGGYWELDTTHWNQSVEVLPLISVCGESSIVWKNMDHVGPI